ncbi:hypothetical protein B5X24_HaOG216265 [Helicoverpa armigera]|nr:hypothetical protein B5X24_HaOG216265 [Helicoverpa armigera]
MRFRIPHTERIVLEELTTSYPLIKRGFHANAGRGSGLDGPFARPNFGTLSNISAGILRINASILAPSASIVAGSTRNSPKALDHTI